MKGHLTVLDKMHIQEILMDETIKSILLKSDDDDKPLDVAKKIQIDDDGTIRFCFSNFIWWSKLVNDIKEISFLNFVLLVAKQLSGQNKNRDIGMWKAISQDLLEKAVMSNEYSYCVDALFDICRLGYDGINHSKFTTTIDNNERFKPSKDMNLGNIMLNSGESIGTVHIRFRK